MRRILAGIDCEYGLLVEGRTPHDQIEDSEALVRSYSDECFFGWDDRFENPRADLRGFQLDRLSVDPTDAAFDTRHAHRPPLELRADRVLTNGARFYNDHGHPEYATPESFSIFELARLDAEGQQVVLEAARGYARSSNQVVSLYKNNTDFHGASYGTHESFLVPRRFSFEKLRDALTPMLIARPLLVGAGKVGAERDSEATFQLSQRADFFDEHANAETLWRRPIFNTRDEPHADPSAWIRLHVIAGDANMNPVSTALKVGLVKLVLWLLDCDMVPSIALRDPVKAAKSISRDRTGQSAVEPGISAAGILNAYFDAGDELLRTAEWNNAAMERFECDWVIATGRRLLVALATQFDEFAKSVDWAAKFQLIDRIRTENGLDWNDPVLQAYDLEYSNIDPAEGLYFALHEMGQVDSATGFAGLSPPGPPKRSRAFARAIAVTRFRDNLESVCWAGVKISGQWVAFDPLKAYPEALAHVTSVEEFISLVQDASHDPV